MRRPAARRPSWLRSRSSPSPPVRAPPSSRDAAEEQDRAVEPGQEEVGVRDFVRRPRRGQCLLLLSAPLSGVRVRRQRILWHGKRCWWGGRILLWAGGQPGFGRRLNLGPKSLKENIHQLRLSLTN